ncbi:MAG: glycosyltransferase family 2 protein [Myxococcus sp.]|nr:glycosyltransferase family 2 protein [Myxococcus sp.]
MSLPTVAVITRTSNRPLFLPRALESVRRQTFRGWRHLVVNDGGEPAQVERAIESGVGWQRAQTTALHLRPRVGRGRAANEGLRASTSTLVVFHDDDDTWHPEFLARAVAAWQTSGRRGVVTRTERIVERIEGGRLVELRREPFFERLDAISLAGVARENCFTNLAFLAERGAIETVGGYDETLPVYEDWDFNLRFLAAFDVAFLPEVLAFYHAREGGSGSAAGSFEGRAHAAADARARLVNRWLRKAELPAVGLLMALGPTQDAVEGLRTRLDKAFNFVHGARRTWPLRQLGALLGGER